MKFALSVFTACLLLTACQPVPTQPAPSPVVATGACELSDTAMYGAEAAYNAPAGAYVAAEGRGLLTASVKVKVKPLLIESYEWLKKVRGFYTARNLSGFCSSNASLKSTTSAALALLPAK